MSVRMALAKLCACTCGGALIGGGAVHVAESARPAGVQSTKSVKAAPRRYAARPVKRKVVKTVTACAPQTISVTTQAPPVPLPPPLVASEMPVMSGGGGGPIMMAGGPGFGGGGFVGGFFGEPCVSHGL